MEVVQIRLFKSFCIGWRKKKKKSEVRCSKQYYKIRIKAVNTRYIMLSFR
ncbi:hypothetical protein RB653_002083 [Dictyostelium firmibasis]|uniref:Uncharacterized protein n=1 Tax=Dictyostelium firmibasis TaxID=79012 RepID=A0AAN7YYH4_9MYCE